ncbi:MAG: hypothetical protein E6Q52_06025 [Methylophilus sp.]|jgi:hypothetical protein|nr:MAG: hypothetical protein E6Q52_06025 [Methylophilus sp.]
MTTFLILEKHMQSYMKCLAAVSLAVSCQVAQAGVIVQATAISASHPDFGGSYALVNQINQSGLSAGYVAGVTDFDSFVASTTHDGLAALNSGFSVGPFGSFSYDLGAVYNIDSIGLWATDNTGSVLNFNLYADSDNDFSNGNSGLLGGFTALGSNYTTADPGQAFTFGDVSTRYVHMEILTTDGGAQPGLGEVVFRTATVVPEPEPLALFAAGLIPVCLRLRRKA